jgi:hypothetical protein
MTDDGENMAFSMNSYALFGLPDASVLAFLRVVECFF